jgi:hypothetical protein
MNRYALIFAFLVASSFVVNPPQARDSTSKEGSETGASTNRRNQPPAERGSLQAGNEVAAQPLSQDAVRLISAFTAKAASEAALQSSPQVLFATVPHPVETHLAVAFDHNVDALQDGLQESGYLFDSSWIPWEALKAREQFDDDRREKRIQEEEDETPGILLFRLNPPHNRGAGAADRAPDPYARGIVVFLISEKPTEGIAISQVKKAMEILHQVHVPLRGQIRILGPTYSGSFASLVAAVEYLQCMVESPREGILIRSGAITGGPAAELAIREIANSPPKPQIDFGSVNHDSSDWTQAAVDALERMGVDAHSIATLSEGESLYGYLPFVNDAGPRLEGSNIWKLAFPRDISSLRAGYEQEGLFDPSSSKQPWKRFLSLKSNSENEGDSIRSFGGAATVETQEAVLFGISEFLRSHAIRGAIISATNEDDRLFLTQFLHANNPDVRVVVIGNTRVFMRGSTAQFRGDLMVDSFPMLPRLHDWTTFGGDQAAHIFADDVAQGIYFAAVDMFGKARDSVSTPGFDYKWYAEYSEPKWSAPDILPVQWPPMYVVALGSNSTWPVAEERGDQFVQDLSDPFTLTMPFTLLGHSRPKGNLNQYRARAPSLHVARLWKILLLLLAVLTATYCAATWYANPITNDHFASLQPSPGWEYWILKQLIPAVVAGCAFAVMAWAVAIPFTASKDAICWWLVAKVAALSAPLLIVWLARYKAVKKICTGLEPWMSRSVRLAAFASIALGLVALYEYLVQRDASSVLSTYREMHWESGLSLVPTWLLFLSAIFAWASQAGNGAAVLRGAPPLPDFPTNLRISRWRADLILAVGRPLPTFQSAPLLWIVWGVPVAILSIAHFVFGPFKEITTLEPWWTTFAVRSVAAVLAALILFDVLQFLWVWDQLRGLLRALDRERFKRSFVTIREFDWRTLWSFTGVSFQSRRAINTALIDCLQELAFDYEFTDLRSSATQFSLLRQRYNSTDLTAVNTATFCADHKVFFEAMRCVADRLANWSSDWNNAPLTVTIARQFEAIQRALENSKERSRFADEEEELARLPEKNQAVERFLCLTYISFIQTIVARLHTLLMSIASMYSLLALGVAIYPFVPVSPLLIIGGILLLLIAWAFFTVFSQMDKDPVLSRIVNGDDRKLQGNFYLKFAEAMALPLLTATSTLLPGGAGRLLDMVQALLSHPQ